MLRLLIIHFILFSLASKSQITISNHSLTDTTQNIFYVGVDNLVKISGQQYHYLKQSVAIWGGGAVIMPTGPGLYIIKVEKETDSCKMWIGTNKKIIFSKNFICRKIRDIVVRYGGLNDTIATANQLLANPFIYIDIPGSYYKHNYHITSFTATFISYSFDSSKTYTVGNLLTDEQKELIKKLNSGDKIFFDQIYAISPDSRRRKMKSFLITIK